MNVKSLLKMVGILLGVLLLVLGCLQVWFASYKVSDPARAQELYETAVHRVRERDALAASSPENGFTPFRDMFFWKLGSSSQDPGEPFRVLKDFSPALIAKEVDFARPTPELKKAMAEWEARLPDVEKMMGQEHFLWPSDWDQGASASVPNWILMRTIVAELAGYTDYLLVQGRTTDALRYALINQDFAGKVMAQGTQLNAMVGLALFSIGNHELRRVVMLGDLSQSELEEVIARMDALPLKIEWFLERMDEEYAWQMNVIDQLARGQVPGAPQGGGLGPAMLRWSGFLGRERRLLQQMYLEDRAILEKMQDFPANHNAMKEQRMKRAYAVFAQIVGTNMTSSYMTFRWAMTQVSATKLLAALQIFRLQHKRYPAKLDDLPLSELPKDYVGAGWIYEPDDKGGFTLRSGSKQQPYDKPLWPLGQY